MEVAKFMRTSLVFLASALNAVAVTPSFEDFDQRARNGENLTVAFFGGSLTWGARASDPQKTSYRAIIGRKLEEAYPKAHFKFIDAAIGGTGSSAGTRQPTSNCWRAWTRRMKR